MCQNVALCGNGFTLYHIIPTFKDPGLTKNTFENIVGKGENAGYQHFLLFPQCFQPHQTEIMISNTLMLSSANAFNFDLAKFLSFGQQTRQL